MKSGGRADREHLLQLRVRGDRAPLVQLVLLDVPEHNIFKSRVLRQSRNSEGLLETESRFSRDCRRHKFTISIQASSVLVRRGSIAIPLPSIVFFSSIALHCVGFWELE